MRITLQVEEGPHKGRVFHFEGHDVFLVGRSQSAHFQLDLKDRYFSRIHFMVEVNPPFCRLLDMGSRNGTYVNGERVRNAELRDGDLIKAGHTHLRVLMRPDAETVSGSGVPQERTVAFAEPAKGSPPTLPPAEPTRVATVPPRPGEAPALPGYELMRELGRGGMGVVYLARRPDGTEVAIKTIIPAVADDQRQTQRFVREAEILRQLDHPNIVRFHEVGEANGLLYFVMDHVPGTDVGKLLKKQGKLAPAAAVRITCQLLQALAHAHALGFIHRDIKPQNLLLMQAGGVWQVKLADFGLAKVYRSSKLSGLTVAGDLGGTPQYMPPEQVTNYRDVSPLADQYSAAATLYHMLTGKCVHDLPPLPQGLAVIVQEDAVPLRQRCAEVSEELAFVVHRALEREPGHRYASVEDFRQALLPFAH